MNYGELSDPEQASMGRRDYGTEPPPECGCGAFMPGDEWHYCEVADCDEAICRECVACWRHL